MLVLIRLTVAVNEQYIYLHGNNPRSMVIHVIRVSLPN